MIPAERSIDPRKRALVSLCGLSAIMQDAPTILLKLSRKWTTLDPAGLKWVQERLLKPLVDHVDFVTRHVRNFAQLCGPNAALYQPLCKIRETTLRHLLFTQPTPPALTGRWMRLQEAMPTSEPNESFSVDDYLAYGTLEIYGPEGRDQLMTLEIHRWADGLYWVNDIDDVYIIGFDLASNVRTHAR